MGCCGSVAATRPPDPDATPHPTGVRGEALDKSAVPSASEVNATLPSIPPPTSVAPSSLASWLGRSNASNPPLPVATQSAPSSPFKEARAMFVDPAPMTLRERESSLAFKQKRPRTPRIPRREEQAIPRRATLPLPSSADEDNPRRNLVALANKAAATMPRSLSGRVTGTIITKVLCPADEGGVNITLKCHPDTELAFVKKLVIARLQLRRVHEKLDPDSYMIVAPAHAEMVDCTLQQVSHSRACELHLKRVKGQQLARAKETEEKLARAEDVAFGTSSLRLKGPLTLCLEDFHLSTGDSKDELEGEIGVDTMITDAQGKRPSVQARASGVASLGVGIRPPPDDEHHINFATRTKGTMIGVSLDPETGGTVPSPEQIPGTVVLTPEGTLLVKHSQARALRRLAALRISLPEFRISEATPSTLVLSFAGRELLTRMVLGDHSSNGAPKANSLEADEIQLENLQFPGLTLSEVGLDLPATGVRLVAEGVLTGPVEWNSNSLSIDIVGNEFWASMLDESRTWAVKTGVKLLKQRCPYKLRPKQIEEWVVEKDRFRAVIALGVSGKGVHKKFTSRLIQKRLQRIALDEKSNPLTVVLLSNGRSIFEWMVTPYELLANWALPDPG